MNEWYRKGERECDFGKDWIEMTREGEIGGEELGINVIMFLKERRVKKVERVANVTFKMDQNSFLIHFIQHQMDQRLWTKKKENYF